MADFSTNASPRPSWLERVRRELRNPSMLSVILIVVVVAAVPIAIMAPKWVSTAQHNLGQRDQATQLREDSMVRVEVFIPSLIAPWMANQMDRMMVASSPEAWNRTSFTNGPCLSRNLSELPDGKFSDAIVQACHDMVAIQARYAGECPSTDSCNFSDESRAALVAARAEMFKGFEGSGLVLPPRGEQAVGP